MAIWKGTTDGFLWPHSPVHSPSEFPSLRNTSGKQSLRLRGKIQLLCFSGGKTLQLQVFVLWETCLDLFPESTQMCCRQITQPPLHGLSAAICLQGLVEAHAACWSREGLPVFSGPEKRHPEEGREITFLPTSLWRGRRAKLETSQVMLQCPQILSPGQGPQTCLYILFL